MEQKELIITPPEGYEIDKENSTLGHIRFKKIEKPEPKTYDEVARLLLDGKPGYFTDNNGKVLNISKIHNSYGYSNTAPTMGQLEWILALNKLQNVANYLNEGWVPDWSGETPNFYICYSFASNRLQVVFNCQLSEGMVYFKSPELADKAIEILGEKTVNTALGVYKKY